MKDKDIHNLIEQQEPEKKAAMYQEFMLKHSSEQKKPKKVWTYKRLSYIAAAAAVVICLIVALPFMLKNDLSSGPVDNLGGNGGGTDLIPPYTGNNDSVRYFTAANCTAKILDCNLGEYALRFNKPLLHVDMYGEASEVITKLYVNKGNFKDIVYIYEHITDFAQKETIDLYISDVNTNVDILTEMEKKCVGKCIINNVDVKWFEEKHGEHLAAFEYKNNKYYISLEKNSDGTEADPYILSFVMSMLFTDYSL